MKKTFKQLLACSALLWGATVAQAQGLEGIIVEEFHTVTQADADVINDDIAGSSYAIAPGSKVYRVYVDMAPGYKLASVFGSGIPLGGTVSPNPLSINTTTTFWNDDNFGGEVPGQTRRIDEGTAFDTYITVGSTGIAGGAVGCGSAAAQLGIRRNLDTDGDLTTCGVFPGFTGNDGSIPGTAPSLTYNIGGNIELSALNADGSTLQLIDDAWATLPNQTGIDPTGSNVLLIGQFTTDGEFSFQLNIALGDPDNNLETYVHTNAGAGEVVSPFLTYPSAACNAPVFSTFTSNGPICAGNTLQLNALATGDATIAYNWSGPNNFSSSEQNPSIANATVAATGTYTVTASNGCAPDATATVNVVVNSTTNNTTTISACDTYTWSVNGTTYTQSGTYTSVTGCATETLVLTITPSTNNTTTVSECDSYTWSVNGTTYTQSGTYTSETGCATETLVLTITPSTNNTTTVSECDSYTWSVNGTTYTQSGTYTNVVGCATETLVLTILQSGNNTTTVSECDSYTWSVNGTTYTQSGTYTSVTGCSTETLVLTITPSTNTTTTVSECDSYTWAVNGTTYTQSGTYTSVTGCATETLVLTITPSTNNTTTVSECDSYTWSVNGTTYTQSGTYTSVTGCATETLVLTILQGGNNTTTESACDSFTWSVNGTTYTQSGTYTSVTGCSTETLVLTITPSTNNTTTVSECDSYTWSVNGTTYTQSGTYTNVAGCATETLVLTILQSGNNTTTESACDSYTWNVNGTTYTQSGTYTSATGCSTETLVLTITPSTNNTTTETACSSYTWAVNGTTYTQSGTYTNVVGCATETLVLTINIPGTACNDGNNGTINDQLDANCVCVGQPTGGCTEIVNIAITTDAAPLQTSWEIIPEGGGSVLCNGAGNYPASATINETCCLPIGCYALRVLDSAGDGINAGGYILTEGSTGKRIIDNRGNFSSGSSSAISGQQGFCLPLGTDRLIAANCDKLDWLPNRFMVATPNAAVSAQFNVANNTSGYEFWIFDPNGSYSFRRFRNHSNTDGTGTGATRACHFRINGWANSVLTPHIPENVLMNVRIRSRVAGSNSPFGEACRFKIDAARAACPQVALKTEVGVDGVLTCDRTRNWGGANSTANKIEAQPPQPVPAVASTSVRYQFRFRNGNTCIVLPPQVSATRYLNWSSSAGAALVPGQTYSVDVRVSLNSGATWCVGSSSTSAATNCADIAPWGTVCQVTIAGGVASTVAPLSTVAATTFTMYPNPNRGEQLFISINNLDNGVETVSMDIFDMTGKRVSARTISAQEGSMNQAVELNGDLAAGLYLVSITAGDKTFSERLVIQP